MWVLVENRSTRFRSIFVLPSYLVYRQSFPATTIATILRGVSMFASNCQARHRRYLSSSVGKYTANRPKQEINIQNFCTRTLTATLHRISLQPVFFAAAFNLLNPTSVTLLLPWNLPDQNTNKHVSNPATNSHSNKATSHVSPITHVKIVSFVEDSTSAIFTAPISVILLPPRLPDQNKQTGQQTSN